MLLTDTRLLDKAVKSLLTPSVSNVTLFNVT